MNTILKIKPNSNRTWTYRIHSKVYYNTFGSVIRAWFSFDQAWFNGYIMIVYEILNHYTNLPEVLNLIGFTRIIPSILVIWLVFYTKIENNCGKHSFFARDLLNANKFYAAFLDFFVYTLIIVFIHIYSCYFFFKLSPSCLFSCHVPMAVKLVYNIVQKAVMPVDYYK